MAIELGTTDIRKVEIGTTNVKDVRIGSDSPLYINIYDRGAQSYSMTTGYSTGTDGSATFESTYIYLAAGYNGTNSTVNERTARTSDLVDLTNIKTLYVLFEGFPRGTATSNNFFLVASTSATGSSSTFNARASIAYTFLSGETELSLNVSALTGSYYIRVHDRDGSTSSANGSATYVYRIWGI